MGKSYIISSSSKSFINDSIKDIFIGLDLQKDSNSEDIYYLKCLEDKNSIGIEQVKQLINWSNSKPFHSKHKAGIILEAEKLTEQAQNAMLKLLEEPSKSNNYILTTSNYRDLISTITSRCQLILDSKINNDELDISEFIKSDQLGRLNFVNIEVTNENKNIFLLSLLKYYRARLKEGEDTRKNINIINQTQKYIGSNVSLKNSMLFLALNLDNFS